MGETYASKRQQGFFSRFVSLDGASVRLELMSKPGLAPGGDGHLGWAHVALSVGSESAVDEVAARFAQSHQLTLGPRTTGDGFYEAVVQGPDGLTIEITV